MKKVIVIFLSTASILLIGLFVFSFLVIRKLDVREAMSNKTHVAVKEVSVLEKAAQVRKQDFLYYKAFSGDERFVEVLLKNLDQSDKNKYSINETMSLKVIKENDCKKNRCLQFRLPFGEIPLVLTKGLIGIEDYRFLDHFGIDFISIARAIFHDIKAGKLVQGGSTLTQQLAKNLFFTNEKSFTRKIKEVIVSIYMEVNFEKSEILQTYFNEVFWGSLDGIRIKGVESASLVYFNKRARDLSAFESAILVAMLKGPGYYSPIRGFERLKDRSHFIFKKLQKLDLFSDKQARPWTDRMWDNWRKNLIELESNKRLKALYILTGEEDKTFFKYNLILGALRLLEHKKEVSKDLSVKIVHGKIGDPHSFYSRFERKKDIAVEKEFHQIGSVIKPIIYNLLKDFGVSLDEGIELGPISLDLKSGNWSPRESHEIAEKEITLERALQESFNIPVIKKVMDVGFEKFEKSFQHVVPRLKTPLAQYPAQLLGALELSTMEVFKLYSDFIEKECAGDKRVIEALEDPSKTTIRKIVSKDLKGLKFFGKTGTTNNGYDNWFVAYEGNELFVIWTGIDGIRKDKGKLPLYGSNTSYKIFEDIIKYSGRRIGASSCASL